MTSSIIYQKVHHVILRKRRGPNYCGPLKGPGPLIMKSFILKNFWVIQSPNLVELRLWVQQLRCGSHTVGSPSCSYTQTHKHTCRVCGLAGSPFNWRVNAFITASLGDQTRDSAQNRVARRRNVNGFRKVSDYRGKPDRRTGPAACGQGTVDNETLSLS